MAGAAGGGLGMQRRRAGGRETRRHRDCPKKHRGLEGVHRQREMDERGAAGKPID